MRNTLFLLGSFCDFGEKLRKQKSEANLINVFIRSNRFTDSDAPYNAYRSVKLPEASNNSSVLMRHTLMALESIFQEGCNYKKSGVYVSVITPASAHQNVIFHPADRERNQKIMQIMDEVNKKWGRNTLKLAAMGFQKPGLTYRGKLFPRYTTQWNELLEVRCEEKN